MDKESPWHVSFSKMGHSPLNNLEKRTGFYKGICYIPIKNIKREQMANAVSELFPKYASYIVSLVRERYNGRRQLNNNVFGAG